MPNSSASTHARLMVGGDSAGGNLAAVVAIAARDGNGPAIAGQVLIYPAIDFAMTASLAQRARDQHPADALRHQMVSRSLSERRSRRAAIGAPRRRAPRRWPRLPPAYVLTAGADPLRDEGDEYAERLKQAGVAVTYRSFPGQFHGFFTMGKLLQQANVAASEIGAWLKALN